MKLDERSVFAAFSPVLQRVQTVQWAGARAATLGSRLQRDGAVGRVRPLAPDLLAVTVFEGTQQRVELRLVRQALVAECSCGEAPCAHAVAAALEAARLARQAVASVDQQADVLAALRSRLARVPAAQTPRPGPSVLSDLARLPIDAAVDMVALTWRQALRHTPEEVAELLELAARLDRLAGEQADQASDLALRLLAALGAQKIVFGALPQECEPAVHRLGELALDRPLAPSPQWTQLFDLADAGQPQVAAQLAGGLEAVAIRSPELAVRFGEALSGRVLTQRLEWREMAAPTPRDRLADGLVAALVRHGEVATALELARLWPPMRQGALALAAALAGDGRHGDVLALAESFDARGETWQGLIDAAIGAAEAAHPASVSAIVRYAWQRAPSLATFDKMARAHAGPEWSERRAAMAARVLVDDDVAWLATRLAQEADPVGALLPVALQWPLRERFLRQALVHLTQLSPEAAFRLRALRVHSLVVTQVTARTLKDELEHLKACAAQLGEPGLARDLARLLAREVGEKAPWLSAVTAVFGRV